MERVRDAHRCPSLDDGSWSGIRSTLTT
jgi:hypothetical protein